VPIPPLGIVLLRLRFGLISIVLAILIVLAKTSEAGP
jgi:hypothetical protein